MPCSTGFGFSSSSSKSVSLRRILGIEICHDVAVVAGLVRERGLGLILPLLGSHLFPFESTIMQSLIFAGLPLPLPALQLFVQHTYVYVYPFPSTDLIELFTATGKALTGRMTSERRHIWRPCSLNCFTASGAFASTRKSRFCAFSLQAST